IVKAGFDSLTRTVIFTGRPVRALTSPYIDNWEKNRQEEIRSLTSRGIIPLEHDLEALEAQGKLTDEIEEQIAFRPAGYVTGLVTKANQPAKEIVEEIVNGACELLTSNDRFTARKAKL
ncbi:hypothetical protein DH86_00003912, partial [Scytalidium sp. 3C]